MRALIEFLAFVGLVLLRHLLGFEQGAVRPLRDASPSLLRKLLVHHGARVGQHVRLHAPLLLHNADRSFANLAIGDDCHVGRDVFLDLKERITLGARVTVSMRAVILTHTDVGDSSWKSRGMPPSAAPVVLEDDVYIGANATVLPGVRVGRGALVAAGAVVTRDVPAGVRVGGVPARALRGDAQVEPPMSSS
ncbi:MAG: acyltransferase [Planctomycetota bacterium]